MKLEKLLNSLIQRGRDPNNDGGIGKVTKDKDYGYLFHDKDGQGPVFSMRLRDIVSIESGLWQFVCENKLVDVYKWGSFRHHDFEGEFWEGHGYYEYRLMLSSITVDIEQFLLDNIKLDEK